VLFFLLIALLPANAGLGSAISLRFKFRAGDTYTYQTSGQIGIPMPNFGGGKPGSTVHSGKSGTTLNLPVNSTQTVKVLKLESNGNARLEISSSGTSTMQIGQGGGVPTMTTINVIATPLGGLTGTTRGGGGGDPLNSLSGVGALASITVYLPAKSVSPGDSWTQKVSVPQMSEMANMTAVFEKLSQVGRYKTAHIKLTVTIPISSKVDAAAATQGKQKGEAKVGGVVTMHYEDDFAIAEGRLIKSIGTGSADLNIKQSGVVISSTPGASAPPSVHIAAKLTMTSTLVQ
jgi:hypothetical protein